MAATIELLKLKSIVNALFDKLIEAENHGAVMIPDDTDYYWDIANDERYEPAKRPADLHMGRLSEDWEFLQPLSADEKHLFPLMFMHVAPLINFLADRTVKDHSKT